MNYLIIVNKSNPMLDSYYENLDLVECKNIIGEPTKVNRIAYSAYLELKEFLKTKNIFIEIDSAFRDVEYQQRIIDSYLKEYGVEYTKKYVAPIGTSEHHTGLAIDLALIVDGENVMEPDDLFDHESIFLEIHKYLSKYGFILRYLPGKEDITGYAYEPWHIRYVGKEVANEICEKNLTLEEYLQNKNEKGE